MTPTEFLDEVAQPNMQAALERPDDVRALVNAVLTLDALAGIVHAHGLAAGEPAMAKHEMDDRYRMLERVVDGGPTELDEYDYFTRSSEA